MRLEESQWEGGRFPNQKVNSRAPVEGFLRLERNKQQHSLVSPPTPMVTPSQERTKLMIRGRSIHLIRASPAISFSPTSWSTCSRPSASHCVLTFMPTIGQQLYRQTCSRGRSPSLSSGLVIAAPSDEVTGVSQSTSPVVLSLVSTLLYFEACGGILTACFSCQLHPGVCPFCLSQCKMLWYFCCDWHRR